MSKLVINKYSLDKKELSVIFTFLCWLIIGFFLIMFVGINNVFAATYDTGNVTWYYREIANESVLLSTEKNINTPVHIISGEYLNGFKTRIEHPFSKNLQYLITYKLKMLYYDGTDGAFREDTISRLIEYSWVDSDFKLLNTNVNQSKYLCESSFCEREFTISQQILTLNSTPAINFGVYTTLDKSIGFYNPPNDGVNMTLSNIITIEDNSSSTIIDQNNQIIDGQNSLQNSITNTQDSINQNIDDMEQSIVDSNKETQDVIKDQFNDCRDSNNLFNKNNILSVNDTIATPTDTGFNVKGSWYVTYDANDLNGTYTINYKFVKNSGPNSFYRGKVRLLYTDNTYSDYYDVPYTFNANNNINKILFYVDSGTDLLDANFNDVTLNKGTSYKPYESYGEICSNKIDDTNNKLDDINGSLNNSNTTGATNDASNFFSNFTTDTFGLTSIITAPLSLINNLTSSSCSTLSLPLPYLDNKYLELPCMNTIYSKYFGSFFDIYQTITFGIVAYWVIVRIFNQVKDFKNPDHDEIEVLDL